MAFGVEVEVEHLNHLGIVAEVCREIGVADWLDAQDPTSPSTCVWGPRQWRWCSMALGSVIGNSI